MKCGLWIVAVFCGLTWGEPVATVQVRTVPLLPGVIPSIVSGFGIVVPSPNSLKTISLSRSVQITALRVSEGQVVRKGTVLAEVITSQEALQSHRLAQHAAEFAKNEVGRVQDLESRHLATRSQLESAQRDLADAQENLRVQGEMGSDKLQESIRAPFDGLVSGVSVAEGDRIASGSPLFHLARSGKEQVRVGIEPSDIPSIKPGMQARVENVFAPRTSEGGRVTQVFGMIDSATRLVDVLVELLPGSGFLPGTRVRVRVDVKKTKAFAVPRSAVLLDSLGGYVFQVKDGKARRVEVNIESEDGQTMGIQGKLDPKAPVVSVGNYELHEGMVVREARP